MIVYFSSKTGNTRRFVEKLEFLSYQLTSSLIIEKPFVLITGTYARNDGTGAVHPSVVKFLNNNRHNIIGVAAGGNRNFGRHFAYAADIISYKCEIPILHKFELFGNDNDVDILKDKIKEMMYNV